MKRKMMAIIATLTIVTSMIFGNTETYAKTHKHAYSYVGDQYIRTQQVAEHQAPVYSGGTIVMETCYIYVDVYAEVEKCGCGETRYNYYSRQRHSNPNCGH